jgi:hypothetical protein
VQQIVRSTADGQWFVISEDFLQERHLTHKNDFIPLLDARQRLEKSLLLETMRDICVEINAQAGTVIVEEHHYLPPEPIISSNMFKRGQTEYVMRLELWGPTPCLAIITRKWRDDSSNRFSRWIYRLAGMEPISVNIKLSCELPAGRFRRKDQTMFILSSFAR